MLGARPFIDPFVTTMPAYRGPAKESSIMAEEGNVTSSLNLANGEDTAPAAGLISRYVKDLSVENPNAPDCFQWQDPPQLDVQFNIAGRPINDEVHEVTLRVSVTAKMQQGTAYMVELAYCGLVGMRNMPDEHMHAFIYAEAPRFLFPFARRVIADATRDAGFTPLVLDPIDFNAIYAQQLAAQQQQQGAEGSPEGQA